MLLRPASLALVAGLAFAAPASAIPADNSPVVVEHVKAPAQPTPSAQDSTSYAQRERQDQKPAHYKGGNVVIIGASGGAILVVLLLLLILV